MGKPERKSLFMSTYPSSLSFILDYHKNITAKIRTLSSQLKLLNSRKLSLTSEIMAPATLEHHRQFYTDLERASLALDRDLFLLTHQLKQYDPDTNVSGSPETYIARIRTEIVEPYRRMFLSDPMTHTKDTSKLNTLVGKFESDANHLVNQISTQTEQAMSLVNKIEQLKENLKSDNETAIVECQRLLAIEEETMVTQGCVDPNVPIATPTGLATLVSEYDNRFKAGIEYLTANRIQHWSSRIYRKVEDHISKLDYTITCMAQDLKQIDLKLDAIVAKLCKFEERSYPPDCTRGCKLRDSVRDIVVAAELEKDDLLSSRGRILRKLERLNKTKTTLKNELQHRGAAGPIIAYFETFFSRLPWAFFVCFERDVVSAINLNISKLHNNYLQLIENTKAANIQQECKEKIAKLTDRITSLRLEKKPMVELLTVQLMDHEIELQKLTQCIVDKKQELERTNKHHGKVKQYKLLMDKMIGIAEEWVTYIQQTVARYEYAFLRDLVSEMESNKTQVQKKMRELDSIIDEQNKLYARLNDEIEPTIQQISGELDKLMVVEQQLSPTKGIPHKYIIRYLNSIFTRANRFIQLVWNYNMALDYFSEEEPFDYTFRVLINDGTVKDVGMCSTGQKAIIDLAVTLAICVYRGYARMFPTKLDEVDAALTPTHRDKLTAFLGELFHQDSLAQSFIVNHYVALSSAFHDAGVVALSPDEPLPANLVIKSIQR